MNVVELMTGDAARLHILIMLIDMALGADDFAMGSLQGKVCCRVIEFDRQPAFFRVTTYALFSSSP